MNLNNYAFIIMAPDYSATKQHSVLENEHFRSEVIGVSSTDEAVTVARELISKGVQLIELCGGFGEEKATEVISRLDTQVPIGFVGFTEKENNKLSAFMADT